MRTFLRLKNQTPRRLPDEFSGVDVRYADELVAAFVRQYTVPGDTVFDPFAGFGTTLIVAEAMGRTPLGVELEAARVAYIRTQLHDGAAVRQGDARRLSELGLPPCDLVMTSPPFTERGDPEDALANYARHGEGYDAYLRDMRAIFAQVREVMRPGSWAVLEVANLRGPHGITTLAWDVAQVVSEVLRFEGEVVITWDRYAYGYDHSYCLRFTRG